MKSIFILLVYLSVSFPQIAWAQNISDEIIGSYINTHGEIETFKKSGVYEKTDKSKQYTANGTWVVVGKSHVKCKYNYKGTPQENLYEIKEINKTGMIAKVNGVFEFSWSRIKDEPDKKLDHLDNSKPVDPKLATIFTPASPNAPVKTEVPVADYPKAIIGKWDIRTYAYTFNQDGTHSISNPDDGSILQKGTWKVSGTKLALTNDDGTKQTVNINFSSKDAFSWEGDKGRTWDAERIVQQVNSTNGQANIEPKAGINSEPIISQKNTNSQKIGESITYGGTWIFKGVSWSLLTYKFQNIGKNRIKAFRGTFAIKDDFDEITSRFNFEFSSQTTYATKQDSGNGHIIEPGEIIYINTYTFPDGHTETHATPKNSVLEMLRKEPSMKNIKESDAPAQYTASPKKLSFIFGKAAFVE